MLITNKYKKSEDVEDKTTAARRHSKSAQAHTLVQDSSDGDAVL